MMIKQLSAPGKPDTMSPKKRLFFALWPDDLTRQKCMKVAQGLNKQSVHWIEPVNLHVTLVFLGYVSAEQELALRQEATRIVFPKFSLCFNQLSYWKKPGILCLTSTDAGADLRNLVGDLSSVAKNLHILVESRPYKPHVTLAKKVRNSWVQQFEPINWFASSFALIESVSHEDLTRYRIIEQWQARPTASFAGE